MNIPGVYNVVGITDTQVMYATGCLGASSPKKYPWGPGCQWCAENCIQNTEFNSRCPNCGKALPDSLAIANQHICECGSTLVTCSVDRVTILVKFTVDSEIVKDMNSGEDII